MPEEPKDEGKPVAPKKKRNKRVIAKHLEVARNVARGKTLQKAGEVAGYPPKSARQAAWEAMQTVKRKAPEIFDKEGLTLESLAQDVNRLRRAKEIRFYAHKGIILDSREVEALNIQAEAVDMALRVHGAYGVNKQDGDARDRPARITIRLELSSADEQAEVAAIIAARRSGAGLNGVDAKVDQNSG